MKSILFLALTYSSICLGGELKVAVIDTGVDTKNSQLNPYISPKSFNFAHNNNKVSDQHGHGTHIASLIVEHSQLSPAQLQLIVIKYYDENQSATKNLKNSVKALEYAINSGVDIINYSAGGTEASPEELNLLKKALQKNILVIAAAGNEHSNSDLLPFYPASYQLANILSVGAHDKDFGPVESSNYGIKAVHLSALGKGVMGFLPENRRAALTGTSQATAITTGVAAQLWVHRKDLRSPTALKEQLLKTGTGQKLLRGKNATGASLAPNRALQMRGSLRPALIDEKLAQIPQNDIVP